MGPMTLTVANTHGYREGDVIILEDRRPWYVRFWAWVKRAPKPQLKFRVTRATETSLDMEPFENDPGYRYHRPQDDTT